MSSKCSLMTFLLKNDYDEAENDQGKESIRHNRLF